jgi:outer membrane protein OmpA-like peptidoglycan-associated protein
MKRSIYLILFIFSLITTSFKLSYSQEYMPFTQSNYAGVSGIMLQPASIADSRYKFDMVIFGINGQVSNNYLSLQRKGLFKFSQLDDSLYWDQYLKRHENGKDKTGLAAISAFLPSFMVNINDKSAFAFTITSREIVNLDNVTEDLATFLAEDFDYEPLLNKTITNKNVSIKSHAWTELGLTFAQVIPLKSEVHFLKGGITLKYLQGIASGYVNSPEFSFRVDRPAGTNPDILSIYNSRLNYGLAGNFDNANSDPFDFISDPGFGMNIGFVYEYRPNINDHKYNMDGREGMQRPDEDKYLLRIGVSLVDLGSIKYSKMFNSQDFTANIINWQLSQIHIKNPEDLNDTLKNRFNFKENVSESFRMSLPTALNISVDYRMAKDLYLNFSPYISLRNATALNTKTHYYSTFSLTPRYDQKWFGAAIPIQVDQFGRLRTGLALRMGPIWIGTNTGISAILGSKTYNIDAYAMVKIPVFRNIPKDRDKDAVSNKLDQCIDVPGVWAMKGCPDTDGDGITDANDKCPTEPGPAELNGCPDRDGDGISDKNDNCPDEAGLAKFNGCPDSDGDGIIDSQDHCPNQAGIAALNGCPDRDGDGIADKDDECPDLVGSLAMNGCPDRDNDGVADKVDNCPDQPGKPEFGGCPFADYDKDGVPDEMDECPASPGPKETKGCPDTDGDGIADNVDMCPKTPGTVANKGCPEMKKEEKEIIARAFSNLEFETGKAVIKPVSYPSLNELAGMLKAKSNWKVQLSGHTDNTGTPAKNLELSKNRAQAVKDYLIGQGVEEPKILVEWFGQQRPVADNKTAAGRQKNRRVEMKIVFE